MNQCFNSPDRDGGINLQVPVSVPWFEAWRDTFLQVQFPSDHEFTKHYVACMLVVSSRETSPLDMFVQMGSQLQQMQTISPAKLPKWFSPAVLRYHILLHDNTEGDTPLAESLFETMKTTYGVNNVFFLSINSQQASTSETHMPDPWSQFLTRQLQSQDVNEADLELARNHLEGLNIVETAQEAGESTPTTPIIMHPLSPVSDSNSAFDKTLPVDLPFEIKLSQMLLEKSTLKPQKNRFWDKPCETESGTEFFRERLRV
ncbi:Trafficking protein particle complex 8 [Homalodisca vitripennis]|nr:Trafficking protein particle complex 8 [Homalodisca vitripennis]KAG8303773.1 Trafficking protein particle complex 8 [Homalodisca vitripennis]